MRQGTVSSRNLALCLEISVLVIRECLERRELVLVGTLPSLP